MISAGLYIGINYNSCAESKLNGCVNDVLNISNHLDSIGLVSKYNTRVLVDEGSISNGLPTRENIITELYALKHATWTHKIDLAWIHYSGHGASIRDWSNDETDAKDECILPCDYKISGVIIDDRIKKILNKFNPSTRVICVFDCCHSGTIADLKYQFIDRVNAREAPINPCKPLIICLSGCMDKQTSADAYNVLNMRKFSGAMSSCLLTVMQKYPDQCRSDVFFLIEKLKDLIKDKGFTQIPQITSSKDLRKDTTFY